MSTVIEDVLPIIDQVRGEVLDEVVGLYSYDILMRVIAWSGERPGVGTKTVVDTTLTLDGTHRIYVNRISSRDIIASGGKYAEGDWKVGPLTPSYDGGGRDPSYFNPPPPSSGSQEVLYRLTGPGFESGAWFKKIDQQVDGNFGLFFVLRNANLTNPGG
jgi:hypothetical protein